VKNSGMALSWVEQGLVPDAVVRSGIRRLCEQRLRELAANDVEQASAITEAFVHSMRESVTAPLADAANRQHYEVPAEFFALALGPRRKYSSAWWPAGTRDLAQAEERALEATCQRAGLADGQRILELGCGWGSLTLWMAERYPNARITAVSNSAPQREFIESRCRERGFANVHVLTRDANRLELPRGAFDRCVSIEMFEHMRNYDTLLGRIGDWLRPGGRLFVHVFCHRTLLYPFDTAGDGNWMGRHFFTGGLMPSADTFACFQRDLVLERRWLVDGRHYQRTANHWLDNQDRNRDVLMPTLRRAYGETAPLWFQRWRMFWMACAELFGHAEGSEWMVAHYLFERRA